MDHSAASCHKCLPTGTVLLITSVIIVADSAAGVPLAESGHVAVVVIMPPNTIASSLGEPCHITVAVVMTCNTTCSANAKSSAHKKSPSNKLIDKKLIDKITSVILCRYRQDTACCV